MGADPCQGPAPTVSEAQGHKLCTWITSSAGLLNIATAPWCWQIPCCQCCIFEPCEPCGLISPKLYPARAVYKPISSSQGFLLPAQHLCLQPPTYFAVVSVWYQLKAKREKVKSKETAPALFISEGGREAAATARRGTICRESATSQIYCRLIKLTFVISQGREEGGKKSSSLLLNYLCPGSLHAMLGGRQQRHELQSPGRGTGWATAGPPDL